MMAFKRVFGIVLDSVGIGEAEDAAKFDDVGSDTLAMLGRSGRGICSCPTCKSLDYPIFE